MAGLEGTTLKGRYRIDEMVGRGGMAEVYKAWDNQRHYHVALKVLRADLAEDREFDRRFRREAQALARLAHRNIVRVYSFEREGRLAYIVMDYVEGITLRTRLFDADGPLPISEFLSILQQIVGALHYAHSQKVLHRDVKPGNIMIQPDGVTLVADFGIAKAADLATMTTAMPGTPAYMSPEQCRSEPLDVRTDVYSLGVVAYEMLAGRRPFRGDSAEAGTGSTREKLRWEQMHAAPPSLRRLNPAVPREAERVVLKALAKERGTRWPTALVFWQALEGALGRQREVEAAAEPVPIRPRRQLAEERVAVSPPPRAGARPPSISPAAAAAAQPRAVAEPGYRAARLARTPPWVWALVGVMVTGFLILVLALMSNDRAERQPTNTPAPVAVATAQPTNTPQPADTAPSPPTNTPRPADTATSPPTNTPRPSDTATPRPTNTRRPTATPRAPAGGGVQARAKDGMALVYVPAGEFEMGSIEGASDERPVHTIWLNSFWIDQTEVTNTQYRQCAEAGACEAPTECDWGIPTYEDETKADHPVVCVDWFGAQAYCEWAGGRLPTEAEWEYAARGPAQNTYPWGDTFDGELLNYCDANCEYDHRDSMHDDGYEMTAPVGSYSDGASWCGALDMAGNVWEWVADRYDNDHYADSPSRNPTGPSAGDYRVLRGGSWTGLAKNVRSADRDYDRPSPRYHAVGFRCVATASGG